MVERIAGTMLWINLNSKKTTDWRKCLRTMRSADLVFQTYVIHNTKDSRRTESDCWWKCQSNVHGVVIATDVVLQCTIHEYPRRLGAVVEHFIPGIEVAETDSVWKGNSLTLVILSK